MTDPAGLPPSSPCLTPDGHPVPMKAHNSRDPQHRQEEVIPNDSFHVVGRQWPA